MTCKWGRTDCKNIDQICYLCPVENFRYEPTKKRMPMKKRSSGPDGRMGSRFEASNHERNKATVNTEMTLNSGATSKEKGDEQIRGIIEVMEELKTQMPTRKNGTDSFAIKRKWLEKLNIEAKYENKEFWYLKFCFSELETNQVYVVVEEDIIMSMVKTMIIDRKKALEVDAQLNLYKKKYEEQQAQTIALEAKISALEAARDYAEINTKTNKLFNNIL